MVGYPSNPAMEEKHLNKQVARNFADSVIIISSEKSSFKCKYFQGGFEDLSTTVTTAHRNSFY